uniref:Odorant receptor n=1 Tax=Lobesia botrana TaxID=209534 RepID=A0A345BEX0_9NEOP|nr:odorant receptors OR49.2 [Lobesia botrana]
MWESVRRFGLAHCDLPTLIWNVSVMLRLLALKVQKDAAPIPKSFYVINAACAVCYIFNYQLSMLCFVFVGCRQTGDVLAAILVFSIGTNSLIGITKLMYLFYYQDNVQSMVDGYLAYDTLPPAPSTVGLMAATMTNVKKRAMLFWAVMMGNGFVYNLQPLLMPSRHVLYDEHVLFGLQLILGTSNYLLALVFIFTSVAFICYTVSNITGLLIITTGYSEARMLALSAEMCQLWNDARLHYDKNFNVDYTKNSKDKLAFKEMNKYIKMRLKRIVQSHATNINLVKKIEDIFREAIATEFALLAVALICDLLGGLEQTYIILPFALMQVSMDCYIGQKLMEASEIFEAAVYSCNWEEFDAPNMKSVLMILKMSQKTLTLSAGGVSTLSFGFLMLLIKSVYSAYAALRSTMESN